MSKKKGKTPQPAAKKMTASTPKMEAFTFGEPVPVQDRIREINGWLGQEVIRFKNYSLDTDNG